MLYYIELLMHTVCIYEQNVTNHYFNNQRRSCGGICLHNDVCDFMLHDCCRHKVIAQKEKQTYINQLLEF